MSYTKLIEGYLLDADDVAVFYEVIILSHTTILLRQHGVSIGVICFVRLMYSGMRICRKHNTLTQRYVDAGPASQTVAQQQNNIEWTCCVCWDMSYLCRQSIWCFYKTVCIIAIILVIIPANTTHYPSVRSMLVRRRRRWVNIKPTLGQYVVLVVVYLQLIC